MILGTDPFRRLVNNLELSRQGILGTDPVKLSRQMISGAVY